MAFEAFDRNVGFEINDPSEIRGRKMVSVSVDSLIGTGSIYSALQETSHHRL